MRLVGEAEGLLVRATEQPLAQFDGLLSQIFHFTEHRPQFLFVCAFVHLLGGLFVSAVPTQPQHNCLIPLRPTACRYGGLFGLGRHLQHSLKFWTGFLAEKTLVASVMNSRDPS